MTDPITGPIINAPLESLPRSWEGSSVNVPRSRQLDAIPMGGTFVLQGVELPRENQRIRVRLIVRKDGANLSWANCTVLEREEIDEPLEETQTSKAGKCGVRWRSTGVACDLSHPGTHRMYRGKAVVDQHEYGVAS